jgi:hypothetical protein
MDMTNGVYLVDSRTGTRRIIIELPNTTTSPSGDVYRWYWPGD